MRVGDKAIALIVAEEIGSEDLYTARYQHPVWPGGLSGVTIGIGYDCGQHDAATIRGDWAPYLPMDDVDTLCTAAGFTGSAAQVRARLIHGVVVPIVAARRVFDSSTLPRYAAETEAALPNCDKLPADAFGALVSIGYNRGNGGWDMDDDRHLEMSQIGDAMDAEDFAAVPDLIRAMKRHWDEDSVLWRRRLREADLFEHAMKG